MSRWKTMDFDGMKVIVDMNILDKWPSVEDGIRRAIIEAPRNEELKRVQEIQLNGAPK